MGIISIDPAKKAEIDKSLLIADLEKWFAETSAAGFTTEEGWKLGMSQQDVSLLTGNYVLAKEAAALGLPLPPVIDSDGVSHNFSSIDDMTALMLEYGQARSALSAEYAAKKKAILDGTQP